LINISNIHYLYFTWLIYIIDISLYLKRVNCFEVGKLIRVNSKILIYRFPYFAMLVVMIVLFKLW